jgi:hypothetical protein
MIALENTRPCPECGKPMIEEPEWKGLWTCPDSKIKLNDAPPFRFKCDGKELTNEGVEVFETEYIRLIAQLN